MGLNRMETIYLSSRDFRVLTTWTTLGHHIAESSGGGNAAVNYHSYNTVFDQRNHPVKYQYNVVGDINFNAVQDRNQAAIKRTSLRRSWHKRLRLASWRKTR